MPLLARGANRSPCSVHSGCHSTPLPPRGSPSRGMLRHQVASPPDWYVLAGEGHQRQRASHRGRQGLQGYAQAMLRPFAELAASYAQCTLDEDDWTAITEICARGCSAPQPHCHPTDRLDRRVDRGTVPRAACVCRSHGQSLPRGPARGSLEQLPCASRGGVVGVRHGHPVLAHATSSGAGQAPQAASGERWRRSAGKPIRLCLSRMDVGACQWVVRFEFESI